MSWLLGILGVLAGIVAATWAAYRSGASDQRARTLEALAEAGKRRSQWEAEEDEKIERDRKAATEAAEAVLGERKAEAAENIDEAERKLRERTAKPWPPKN